MRRIASGTPRSYAAMSGVRTSGAAAAASFSSQSLFKGATSSAAPLFSRSASLATPSTARLFARTAKPLGLAGRPLQQRFASTTAEGVQASGSGRARITAIGVLIAAVGGVTGVVYAAEGGNQGEEAGLFANLKKKFTAQTNKLLNIDENKKILPDAHPPPYGKPITVVISDDVLLVQEYQPLSGGMLTKKRPGVEFFLAQLSQDYELVIWSLQQVMSFGPVIEKLDPNHHAAHRVYVDATVVNAEGMNVKDLKFLNRPLDKTIVLDISPDHVVQKENLIVAPKYDGRLEDVYLLEMLNFFRLLAASSKSQSGVPDVRNWVGAMNKKGPQYFKELYADAVKKAKDRAEEERKKREEQLQMRDVGNTGRKW